MGLRLNGLPLWRCWENAIVINTVPDHVSCPALFLVLQLQEKAKECNSDPVTAFQECVWGDVASGHARALASLSI